MSAANEILNQIALMFPEVRCELDFENHYQLLIAVLLSAQTTDQAVNKVTKALFEKYPDFHALAKAKENEVHPYIKTIGLANTKAKNMIALAKKIVKECNGEVVPDFEYLITLPGVGRKTANVVLSEGFRIPRMPVDTHVLRVSNRLKLADSDNPEVVEKQLMDSIPPSDWYLGHLRLLFFGRYFCKAKNPACKACPFTSFCQYYTKNHPKE